MYIETSLPRKRGDRARLESTVFPATTGKGRCMQFWYHMTGAHIGALNVYMKVIGQSETKLWSLGIGQKDVWYQAQVPVVSGGRSYQVEWSLFSGTSSITLKSYAAYLNLSFHSSDLSVKINLTVQEFEVNISVRMYSLIAFI